MKKLCLSLVLISGLFGVDVSESDLVKLAQRYISADTHLKLNELMYDSYEATIITNPNTLDFVKRSFKDMKINLYCEVYEPNLRNLIVEVFEVEDYVGYFPFKGEYDMKYPVKTLKVYCEPEIIYTEVEK